MTDGVHEARGLEATRCHPRSFGRSEARTGVIGVSPRGRDVASRILLAESCSAGNEETDHASGHVPSRRQHRRSCGHSDCSDGESHRGRGRKCPPMARGRLVRLRGALRHHWLPQRPIGPRKRRSTVRPPSVHHPHGHEAGRVRPRHDSLMAENCS